MSKETKREILGMTTISYKYQMTLPKKVREKYRLKEGDTVMFVEEGGRVYLAKSTEV